jgi:carbon storage regulator
LNITDRGSAFQSGKITAGLNAYATGNRRWVFCPRIRGREVMLVLSRKKNESIVINNEITIVVVEIRGDKVRLGVEAPREVPVHRREVYDAIQRTESQEPEKSEE